LTNPWPNSPKEREKTQINKIRIERRITQKMATKFRGSSGNTLKTYLNKLENIEKWMNV
jgi:hypothetical protein